MIAPTRARFRLAAHGGALLLAAVFVALQSLTLDYGTRINDLPFIRDYRITGNVIQGSALEREAVIGTDTGRPENLDRAMLRFKLYTVDADEVDNVMALARMRPARFQFDPHFYQYGGAFLYPLGAYYAVLSRLGVLSIGSFEHVLANPQAIDRVWIAGRAFVLLAVVVAGLLLYLALIEIATPPIALMGLAIFLFCPATIMFSQVLKPHWYALMFTNAVLLIMARAFIRRRLTGAGETGLGVALGLAVGSVPTFALFAVLVWGALLILFWRRQMPAGALVRIPAIAIVTCLIANPYYVLDWQAVVTERVAQAGWFEPALTAHALLSFARNSILSGFGIALSLMYVAVLIRHLMRPAPIGVRLLGFGILIPIVVMAAITVKQSAWHSSFRYIPYVLPAMIVFLAVGPLRHRETIFAAIVAVTVLQAVPLKLAYFDENSATHSTRLVSAAWIDAHVPPDETICVSTHTMAPYNVPPFRFDRRRINAPDCRWRVRVEGNPEESPVGSDWNVVRRLRPRLSPAIFPLVWEHINPQITIYRKR
jgi:hypothetical protein